MKPITVNKMKRVHRIHPSARHVTDYSVLLAGDQVAVQLQIEGVHIWHHGILVQGRSSTSSKAQGRSAYAFSVIDFGSVDSVIKKFEHKTLEEFQGLPGVPLVKINYKKGETYRRQKVMGYAWFFYQNQAAFGHYNVVTNNCEHFATFVKTGVRVSEQILTVLRGNIKEVVRIATEYLQAKGWNLQGQLTAGNAPPSQPSADWGPMEKLTIGNAPSPAEEPKIDATTSWSARGSIPRATPVNNKVPVYLPTNSLKPFSGSVGLLKWRVMDN